MSLIDDVKTKVEEFVADIPAVLAKAEADAKELEGKVADAVSKLEPLIAEVEKLAPTLAPYLVDVLNVLKVLP